MTDSTKSARESMEKSRIEVMECEEEIKSIKTALKAVSESSRNGLEVSVHKVKVSQGEDGDDAENSAPTTFKINLSSPIEERTITQLYDPLNPTEEGSFAKFESIETSNALLTVEVYSNDEPSRKVGVSAPHDLMPLCQDLELWKKGGEKKSSTLEVAIVAEKGIDDVPAEKEPAETDPVEKAEKAGPGVDAVGGEEGTEKVEELEEKDSDEWEDAVAEEVEEDGETEELAKEGEASPESDDKKDETEVTSEKDDAEESVQPAVQDDSKPTKLQLPLYTLTLQLEYTPSSDDKRDALYDKLNEVSKRKVAAIESLRKNAVIVNRAKATEAPKTTSAGNKNPVVKSGFLNKSKASDEKPPPFWKRWYNKTIGPNSMLWVVGPVAKNYVIFVGVSFFIHYKGDLLALPPPV